MELSEYSDRMATDILSAFDPFNKSSYSYANGITEEEEESVLTTPPPPSDRQRAVHPQLNGHVAAEQDLLGEGEDPSTSDGGKGVELHTAQKSSVDAMRSDGGVGGTWSRDSLEQCPAPLNREQTSEPEAARCRDEGRIASVVAPEPERTKSAETKEAKAEEQTKAPRFRPQPFVRSYERQEPSPKEVNGDRGDRGNIRSERGSVIGHANLVKKHLDFFMKLPEKQRLSPRVRRLMEVGLCYCRANVGGNKMNSQTLDSH